MNEREVYVREYGSDDLDSEVRIMDYKFPSWKACFVAGVNGQILLVRSRHDRLNQLRLNRITTYVLSDTVKSKFIDGVDATSRSQLRLLANGQKTLFIVGKSKLQLTT